MKRIRSVQIDSKRWRVMWVRMPKDWGTCSNTEHIIELDTAIKDTHTYAEILLHEMLHGMFPEVEEDFINLRAAELAVALSRADLLKTEDDE